jgi:hypothetical protein
VTFDHIGRTNPPPARRSAIPLRRLGTAEFGDLATLQTTAMTGSLDGLLKRPSLSCLCCQRGCE